MNTYQIFVYGVALNGRFTVKASNPQTAIKRTLDSGYTAAGKRNLVKLKKGETLTLTIERTA